MQKVWDSHFWQIVHSNSCDKLLRGHDYNVETSGGCGLPESLKAGEAIIELLRQEGVSHIFGIVGSSGSRKQWRELRDHEVSAVGFSYS